MAARWVLGLGSLALVSFGCTKVNRLDQVSPPAQDAAGSGMASAGRSADGPRWEQPGTAPSAQPKAQGGAGSGPIIDGDVPGVAPDSPASDAGDAGADADPVDVDPPPPVDCLEGEAGVLVGDFDERFMSWDDLRRIRHLTGSVVLYATVGPLWCLERVDGDIRIDLYSSPFPTTLDGLLPRLRSVGGSLVIDGGYSSPWLVGVWGLSALESVGMDLRIYGYSMTSLHGLEQLQTVGGDLEITSLELRSLEALTSLTRIGGRLMLGGTSGSYLRDLHGLEQLTELGGLAIVSFDSLTSLDGLPSLSHFSRDINLAALPALGSIAALAGVRTIDGTFTLDSLRQVLDLAPLSQLTRAGGIAIYQSDVVSLEPLAQLTELGTLFLSSSITSVTGLRSLTSLGSLTISGPLRSLDGLQGVTKLDLLNLDSVSELTDLTGLDNVEAIAETLEIRIAPKLVNLAGLDKLKSVGGYMALDRAPAVTSLHGLEALQSVGSLLSIIDLDALTDLSALSNLTRVAGLQISANASLTSVSGISGVESSAGQALHVFQNPRLPRCDLAALATRLSTECSCPGGANGVCLPGCIPSRFSQCVPCDAPYYCSCQAGCECAGNDNTPAVCPP